MHHLENIVKNNSNKIDHASVMSDLDPSERQNYRSCEKISGDEVLSILESDDDSYATFLYIKLLRYITDAFINKATPIKDRIYFAWTIVFVCRLWKAWLNAEFKSTTQKRRDEYFITAPAYYSVEINAHTLLYLILLVDQGSLQSESLQIPLFGSQLCESLFRSTRSLTGTQSTMVNFPVMEQCNLFELEALSVKTYDKFKNSNRLIDLATSNSFPDFDLDDNENDDYDDINSSEQNHDGDLLTDNYNNTSNNTLQSNRTDFSEQCNLFELEALIVKTYDKFKNSNRLIDLATSNSFPDSVLDDDENDDYDYINSSEQNHDGDLLTDNYNNTSNNTLQSNRTDFSDMRVFESVNEAHRKSYFEVEISGEKKFLHKETAC
ncbi:unnamed protein product [Rotaria sp. Silwood1]|nr:unnamed protein product [Rotaria sp. Silwood1]